MPEAQQPSPEGRQWESTSWYERSQAGLETRAAIEGISVQEALRRNAEEQGNRVVSDGNPKTIGNLAMRMARRIKSRLDKG